MVNKKLLMFSKTLAICYLLFFIITISVTIILNLNWNIQVGIFLIYWLIPIPFIIIYLLLDDRRRKETRKGFTFLIFFLPIIGIFIFIFSGIITYTKKDQIQFTNYVQVLMSKNDIRQKKIFQESIKVNYDKCYCFLDAAKWLNTIHDSILNAKHEICISFFYILQGRNKNALLKALKIKLKEGVKVYVAIDHASKLFGAKNKDIFSLRKQGAIIESIKPFYGILTSFSNNLRSHYKLVVIDGYKCFTGGANIGDLYVHQKKRMGYWNDNYFFIEGKEIAKALKTIISINGQMFDNFTYECKELNDQVKKNSMELLTNQPEFIISKHEKAIKELFKICKKRFYIYIPYLVSPKWLIDGLINLVKIGVDVKVMIPDFPDKKSVYLLTKYNANYLSKNSVKILLLKHTYVHSKTIICDDIVFSGTSNFDNRSLYMNYEIMFCIKDKNSTKSFIQKWFYDELSCVTWNPSFNNTKMSKIFLPIMFLFQTTL